MDLQNVMAAHNGAQARLKEMTARNAAALDQITQLRQGLESRDSAIEKLESAQRATLKKVQFLSDRLTDNGVELSVLNRQLSLIDQEKEAAVKDAEKLQRTYDELLEEFRNEISSREATIKTLQEKLTVTLIDGILFNFGSASISAQGKSTLEKIGAILKKLEGSRIVIAGHTDNVPIGWVYRDKFPTNWELSTARAAAVVRFFQSKLGLDPARMEAVGHAYYKPVVDNDSKVNRAQNRRVEIFVIPE
jgi:chemotaxis protein MotB